MIHIVNQHYSLMRFFQGPFFRPRVHQIRKHNSASPRGNHLEREDRNSLILMCVANTHRRHIQGSRNSLRANSSRSAVTRASDDSNFTVWVFSRIEIYDSQPEFFWKILFIDDRKVIDSCLPDGNFEEKKRYKIVRTNVYLQRCIISPSISQSDEYCRL